MSDLLFFGLGIGAGLVLMYIWIGFSPITRYLSKDKKVDNGPKPDIFPTPEKIPFGSRQCSFCDNVAYVNIAGKWLCPTHEEKLRDAMNEPTG